MDTIVHFINVGQGNMSLIETSNRKRFVFDCNITDNNEDDVLRYMTEQIGLGTDLTAFICSHRDADHMRGVIKLNEYFPIQKIWDSGYPGTSTDTDEYLQYMWLRRQVGWKIIEKRTKQDFGRTRFRYFSAQDNRLAKNANAQGIVLKVEHYSDNGSSLEGSVMLTGDSDAETWRYGIQKDYSDNDISCNVLAASHHGSITFFDDPRDNNYYYVGHIEAMNPDITVVSVGKNVHGHPDAEAIKLYKKYSQGSGQGNKLFRTDEKGHMKVHLRDYGGWRLEFNSVKKYIPTRF